MNKRPRPLKSSYPIKEEQVNFLLEDIERNLEENKKAIEIRDKQLADAKKILKNAKTSYDSIVREKKLKEYIANIKQRFNQYQRQQKEQNLLREKEHFHTSLHLLGNMASIMFQLFIKCIDETYGLAQMLP